jgi:hypothetical protein
MSVFGDVTHSLGIRDVTKSKVRRREKAAQKTEVNVPWHSTGFPSGLSVFCHFCVSCCACAIVVSAGKLWKLWDSLSELRSSLCERRLERTVLRAALLPVKTAQFTQFLCQV